MPSPTSDHTSAPCDRCGDRYRDMLVGTIVGAVILFGAQPIATAIQGLH